MTAPLNPQQFGPWLTSARLASEGFVRANFGGGHANVGYGKYDHLSTEPLSAEVTARVARNRGADNKN